MTPQNRALYLLSAVLLAAVYWISIYSPLSARVEAAEAELVKAVNREQEVAVLERLHAQLEPLLRDSGRNINLVTKLDGLMRARQLKDRVVQMQSQVVKTPADGSLRPNESAILRLDRLDLTQLHRALEAMVSLDRNVWVRTMEIRKQGKTEAMIILEVDELETGPGGE